MLFFFGHKKIRLKRSNIVIKIGGRGWIRTIEAEKQQIYSLPPLATRELSHTIFYLSAMTDKVELVDGLEPPTC